MTAPPSLPPPSAAPNFGAASAPISEPQAAFLLQLDDALRTLAEPEAMMARTIELVARQVGARAGGFVLVRDDSEIAEVAAHWTDGGMPHLPTGLEIRMADHGPGWSAALRAGQPMVIEDIRRDSREATGGSAASARLGLCALITVPIVHANQLKAWVWVGCPQPHAWRDDDCALVVQAAARTWQLIEHTRALNALRASEARFRTVIEVLPVGFVIFQLLRGPDGRAIDALTLQVNPAAEQQTGLRADTVINRRLTEAIPGYEQRWIRFYEKVIEQGHSERIEDYSQPMDRWYSVSATPLGDDRLCVVFEDITARRRADEALRESRDSRQYILRLTDALAPLDDPVQVQATAARVLCEHLNAHRVAYFEIDGDEYIALASHGAAIPPGSGRFKTSAFGEPLLARLMAGELVTVDDIDTHPDYTAAQRSAYARIGLRAFVTASLVKGRLFSVGLTAHSAAPRHWTPAEAALVRETAERTWSAVERARAERALRERDARLRLALHAAQMGTFVWYPGEDRTEADARMLSLFGLPLSVRPSFSVMQAEYVHPEDRLRFARALARATDPAGDGLMQEDIRIRRSDGAERWLAYAARTLFEGTPPRPERMIGLASDITERKDVESALRAGESRQGFLVRLDDTLRLFHDPQQIQSEAAQLLGQRLGADRVGFGEDAGDGETLIISRNYARGVPGIEGRHRYEDYGAALLRTLRLGETAARSDIPNDPALTAAEKTAHAGMQVAAAAAVPVLRAGALAALLFVHFRAPHAWPPLELRLVEDVARRTWEAVERARTERALRETRDELERRVAERTAELEQRTTQLQRLASELTVAEQRAREQLSKTVHDELQQLLVGARLQLGVLAQRSAEATDGADLQRVAADLDEAIASARALSVELFPPILHDNTLPLALSWLAGRMEKKYGLQVELTAAPAADADSKDVRTLVFESVRELLFNVVKHARVNRATVDVAVLPDETLSVVVEDEGAGFDPAALLQPPQPGTDAGLGLFSIGERLTLLGGRFDYDSQPGHGARFQLIVPRRLTLARRRSSDPGELRLPLAASAMASVVARAAPAPVREAAPLRILVADDHASVRAGLRALFSLNPGLQVVAEAADGAEALALAQSLRPDVVVMDVRMPRLDGVEATRQLRALLPQVEVVGLSTQERGEDPEAIVNAGAVATFVKGAEVAALLAYLHQRRAARDAATAG